jgi:L-arabinokinase
MIDLLQLEPVPTLLARTRAELSAEFDFARPMRIGRAPGRLDVMGGIADYTGSLVCEMTLDRAAAVLLQERNDREVQAFSFNLFDEHRPFTFRISLDSLAESSIADLRRELQEPGRRWAGYLVGCLKMLDDEKLIELRDPKLRGINLALLSSVPLGAGVSSSAAIEVATMMNVMDHLGVERRGHSSDPAGPGVDPMRLAAMCQRVENEVVGAPCGIMDQVTSCFGEANSLLRLVCQPHELQAPLKLPARTRVIGINSNVKHSVGGGQYGITRCAAFMGHAMILAKMREIGDAAGKTLARDPMNGYLANLSTDDYKRFFRPYLPQFMRGEEFLAKYGKTIDRATQVAAEIDYPVQHATDHHVLEAMRVRNFCEHLTTAASAGRETIEGGFALDKAGHLMYASHLSYTIDAMLGASECDLLVDLARKREREGIYGAKITGGGSGGTVAILCNTGDRADAAIADILSEYEKQTSRKSEVFAGSSSGAWHVGTTVIAP